MSTYHQGSPAKRRRGEEGSNIDLPPTGEHDWQLLSDDARPRPPLSLRLADGAPYIASSSSARTSSASRSTPRKQLIGLQSRPPGQGGAESCTFDIENAHMPVELVDLVLLLRQRTPLLSTTMRPEVQANYQGTRGAREWTDSSLYGEERDTAGPAPPPAWVDNIVQQARECDQSMLEEGAWSQMVFYPLLRRIFSRQDTHLGDMITVPCTTADIDPNHRRVATPFRKVDYAVAYHPRQSQAHDGLKVLMHTTPGPNPSLNHTSYSGLRARPIVLSAEVKRTSDSTYAAKLQLLAWLSAQWSKMDELCQLAPPQTPSPKPPAYLLALLIQGHDWSLVASSRDPSEERIILWHKLPLGDTQSAMGVYKIVQQVQQLAQEALVPLCQWFQSLC